MITAYDRSMAPLDWAAILYLIFFALLFLGARWWKRSGRRMPRYTPAAILLADHRSGDILAQVGTAQFADSASGGFVDMTRALRSPSLPLATARSSRSRAVVYS